MRRLWGSLLFLVVLVPLLPAQQAEDERPIITVLDFTTESVSQSEMKTIISLLSSSLFQLNAFTVIDVSQRENILSEIEFSAGGCTDESCVPEIGRLLAAEMIVVGNLSKLGTRYVLSSKLLETRTGKTLGTADGIYTDLDAMVDDLLNFGGRLVQAVVGTPQVGASAEQAPVPAPEAVKPPKPPRDPVVIDWKKTAGIGLVSLGAVAAGVGGHFLYDALGPQTSEVDAAWTAYDTAVTGFDDLYELYLTLLETRSDTFVPGLAVAGGSAAVAALGTTILLVPKKDTAIHVSAAVIPLPRFFGVYLSLAY